MNPSITGITGTWSSAAMRSAPTQTPTGGGTAFGSGITGLTFTMTTVGSGMPASATAGVCTGIAGISYWTGGVRTVATNIGINAQCGTFSSGTITSNWAVNGQALTVIGGTISNNVSLRGLGPVAFIGGTSGTSTACLLTTPTSGTVLKWVLEAQGAAGLSYFEGNCGFGQVIQPRESVDALGGIFAGNAGSAAELFYVGDDSTLVYIKDVGGTDYNGIMTLIDSNSSTATSSLMGRVHSSGNKGFRIDAFRSRGSVTSNSVVAAGDRVFELFANGCDFGAPAAEYHRQGEFYNEVVAFASADISSKWVLKAWRQGGAGMVEYQTWAPGGIGLFESDPQYDVDLNGSMRIQGTGSLNFGGTGAADHTALLQQSAVPGVLQMLSANNTNNQLLVFDMETVAGEISLGTVGSTVFAIDTTFETFRTYTGRIVELTRQTGTPYTALATDHNIFMNTDAQASTINLPAGVSGTNYRIVNTGSSGNSLTVTPNGSENLLGANSNFVLADGESLIIVYDSNDGWY
jgi:hypothetical protein